MMVKASLCDGFIMVKHDIHIKKYETPIFDKLIVSITKAVDSQ